MSPLHRFATPMPPTQSLVAPRRPSSALVGPFYTKDFTLGPHLGLLALTFGFIEILSPPRSTPKCSKGASSDHMIFKCAHNHPNQTLQDLIFIEKQLRYLGPSWRQSGCPKVSFGTILVLSGAPWPPLEHILGLWPSPWPS